ncbi:MAG: UTP--glucose-1-phosphate uridylyltransferase [SAR324 cluster bacterium]|nr:UTP--glucose-1-phosphate uridylyltransferase [SAR324 cluster bacterium]
MKGIILAAGYATRFLPASKTIPKEMFPLIDRPVIDYIVQEMVLSGIHDILLVSSRRKKAMEDYFDREIELTTVFAQTNEIEKLERIRPIDANIFMLRQQKMMGTGNALLLVEPFVQDEPFIVAYPDDLFFGPTPLSRQLMDAHATTGKTVLAVEGLPGQDVSRYGVIVPENSDEPIESGRTVNMRQMVEKPFRGTEPSCFVSYGRYLYTPDIFPALKASAHSHDGYGEFTQTEAINMLAARGNVVGLQISGNRYDVGEPLGYVQTILQMAMQRPQFRQPMKEFMEQMLKDEGNGKKTRKS